MTYRIKSFVGHVTHHSCCWSGVRTDTKRSHQILRQVYRRVGVVCIVIEKAKWGDRRMKDRVA